MFLACSISPLQEMYTLQEITENPPLPEMKGYAHIVLNSKFREKYLQLTDGRLLVFEGEFTQRPLQKIDLTGKCVMQLIDDKSIGLEFTCKSFDHHSSSSQLQLSERW